jgi:hypothetical protein
LTAAKPGILLVVDLRASSLRPASAHERYVMFFVVLRPGFQGVADQTGNQPAKGNVLFLGGLP